MPKSRSRSSRTFVAVLLVGAIGGVIFGAVGLFLSLTRQLAVIEALLVGIIGLLAALFLRLEHRIAVTENIATRIDADPRFVDFYNQTIESFEKIESNPNPVLRSIVHGRIDAFVDSLRSEWAEGIVVYRGELWRADYFTILTRDPQLVHTYKSVWWVKSESYWQDAGGRTSLQLNYDLASQKKMILERIFILSKKVRVGEDHGESVRRMINQHRANGIKVHVAFEEQVPEDVLTDFGIYSGVGVGYQDTYDDSRTDKFRLILSPEEIRKAEGVFAQVRMACLTEPEELDKFLEGKNGQSTY